MARELTDITLIFVRETEKALCVQLDGEHEEVWLPKSQVEYMMLKTRTPTGRRLVEVTLPAGLAIEKELA